MGPRQRQAGAVSVRARLVQRQVLDDGHDAGRQLSGDRHADGVDAWDDRRGLGRRRVRADRRAKRTSRSSRASCRARSSSRRRCVMCRRRGRRRRSRYTDEELDELARETDATPRGRFGGRAGAPGRQGGPAAAGRGGAQSFAQRLAQFLKDEGVVATVTTGARGDGGTLFVQGAAAANRQPNADAGLPAVVIAVEHYGRIVRDAAEEHAGQDRPGDQEHVPGRRHGVVQRRRRDPGHRQGRRGRDAGRALRLVARRDRRDRQCRRARR